MKLIFLLTSLIFLALQPGKSLFAQCVGHTFQAAESSTAFSIEVSNECQKDVYFTILGQKESGAIESVLRGYLKKGETLTHRNFGTYTSDLISHEMMVGSDYFKAKESVLEFIKSAKEKGSIAAIEIASKQGVAAIEEE